MAPPVITITRQYASGGAAVAQQVAAALAWTVIDNEFVDEVARRAGLAPATVAEHEERAPGLLERLARTLAVASPEMFITTDAVPQAEQDETTIVKLTERIIAEAAAHGRGVGIFERLREDHACSSCCSRSSRGSSPVVIPPAPRSPWPDSSSPRVIPSSP